MSERYDEREENSQDNGLERDGGKKRKGRMVNEEAQAVCVSRRLAICVVFYDNYKYGRKTLCLEQLVRLSKLYPYTCHRCRSRRLFRL
jgi:hypothetical protein